MKKQIHLSSAYLAPVQYYSKIAHAEKIFIERYDHYIKQTYRNRCVIAGADGPEQLTIPVERESGKKILMKDVRISAHGNWRHNHWNALVAAYGASPYFEFYADDFQKIYEKKQKYLCDFNEELARMILDNLNIEAHIEFTTEYKAETDNDYRDIIHPKKDSREYDPEFDARKYYQVFDDKYPFLPNLSIVDLMFNMGPESVLYL